MIIGIDPGLSGGIAAIDPTGKLLDVIEMPIMGGMVSSWEVKDFILSWGANPRVCIEYQQSMPKQGVASSFKTGMNYGLLLGTLESIDVPYRVVRAHEWKPTFSLTKKSKDESRRVASELFPDQREKWRLKRQDGLAEAALIAEHMRRLG